MAMFPAEGRVGVKSQLGGPLCWVSQADPREVWGGERETDGRDRETARRQGKSEALAGPGALCWGELSLGDHCGQNRGGGGQEPCAVFPLTRVPFLGTVSLCTLLAIHGAFHPWDPWWPSPRGPHLALHPFCAEPTAAQHVGKHRFRSLLIQHHFHNTCQVPEGKSAARPVLEMSHSDNLEWQRLGLLRAPLSRSQ